MSIEDVEGVDGHCDESGILDAISRDVVGGSV